MGEVDVVEDLDKCNEEISDVDTLDMDGLFRGVDLSDEEADLVDMEGIDLLGIGEVALREVDEIDLPEEYDDTLIALEFRLLLRSTSSSI